MGFEKNIAKKIQAGLNARLKAMSVPRGGQPLLSEQILGPISQVDGDAETVADDFKLTQQSVEVKSPYVRMIGVGEETIEVITGLFNESIDTKLKYDKVSGADNLTGGPGSLYNTEKSEDITVSRFGNNAPGISNVECSYVDGGSKGGATRTATVTWQCWTMEDLERFQKTSFLSMGAGIILDWGWVRADKSLTAELEPPNFIIINDGKAEINPDLFTKETNPDGTKNPDPWSTMPEEKYGDWEGIVGIVTGIDWSMNDSGGFDCTTTILAKGQNNFSKEITYDTGDNSLPDPIGNSKTGYDDTGNLENFIQSTYQAVVDDGEFSVEDRQLLSAQFREKFGALTTVNISERLATLDIEIFRKLFSEDVVKKWEEDDPGPQVRHYPPVGDEGMNGGVLLMFTPERIEKEVDEWFGDDLEITFEGNALTTDEKGNIRRNSKFKTEIWIQWGWLEDNIISYYAERASQSDDGGPHFRSVIPVSMQEGSVEASETGQDHGDDGRGNVHTPGQRISQTPVGPPPPPPPPPNIGYQSVQIKNHEKLVTFSSDFLLPGQTPEQWFPIGQGDIEEPTPNVYLQLAKELNKAPAFTVPGDNTSGYLRNIYVSLDVIKSAFGNPGVSIDIAMLKLAQRLNSKMQLWDFEIQNVDEAIFSGGEVKVSIPPYYGIFAKTEPSTEVKDEEHNASNSYIFENYGFNSLLKDLSLKTNIGSKFANAMAFARRKSMNDPITGLLGMKRSSQDESEAEDMAKFFGGGNKQGNVIWEKFILANANNATESNLALQFGAKSTGLKNGIAGPITFDGLKIGAPKWNHDADELLQKVRGGSGYNRLKSMRDRFERLSNQGNQKLDINAITKNPNYDELAEGLNLFAFPPKNLADVVLDEDEAKRKEQQAFLPYPNGFTLNNKYFRTLKWYLSDNPLTSLISAKNKDKIKQLPLEAEMTLEGCGGLKIGNMFRLAYLPQNIYKQIDTSEDFIPGTYFTMMEVSHTINADGWDTSVKGIMRANFKVISDDLKAAATGSIDEQSLKEAVEKSFNKQWDTLTDPNKG